MTSPILRLSLVVFGLLGSLLFGACTLAGRATPAATATAVPLATATVAPATAAPVKATTPAATAIPTARPIVIDTLQDLRTVVRDIATAAPAAAQARADALWQALVAGRRVPLILGQQVVFFYKGDAGQVEWRGAFNGWGAPGLRGGRIGQTDLWTGQIELPAASRVEYKIVLNGQDWIVDPANPNAQVSGLTGDNNVVIMPGFSVSDESDRRAGVTPGTLTAGLSIASQALGYTVNYWVYAPAGYEGLEQLPVLYVLDGNDFVDERMGALPNVLDNLIAGGQIQPVLAVFVDAREPGESQRNRREDEFLANPVEHAHFIAEELVPAIDRAYRTNPRPEARAIVGVSYGGLSAAYIAATQTTVFHNLAAFSPSLWVLDNPDNLADPQQAAGARLMVAPVQAVTECGGDTGYPCPRLPLRIFLTAGVPNWDVGDFRNVVRTLQKQGYPIEFHSVLEGHTWSHWRGLSDEMLVDFFAVPG